MTLCNAGKCGRRTSVECDGYSPNTPGSPCGRKFLHPGPIKGDVRFKHVVFGYTPEGRC